MSNLERVTADAEHAAERLVQDPFPFYEQLREGCPVYKMPGRDAYLLTRYEDVTWASRNTELFTSSNSRFEPQGEDRRYRSSRPTISNSDGPLHSHIRKTLFALITPARLSAYEPMIQRETDILVDRFVDDQEVEFMEALARPLPFRIIGRVLGLPDESLDHLRRWTSDYIQMVLGVFDPADEKRLLASFDEFNNFCGDQLREARDHPREDGISELAAAPGPDGELYPLDELAGNVRQLIMGSGDTTTIMISDALVQALTRPGSLPDRDDRTSLIAVLEESLRLQAPADHPRLCKHDVELHGISIPEGAVVRLMWAAANRDGDAFQHPDTFDPSRPELKRSLAFGRGPHSCIGAPFARMEGYVILRTLLTRFKSIRLSPRNDFARAAKTTNPLSLRELRTLYLELEPANA